MFHRLSKMYVFGSESSATQVLSGLSKITSGRAYSKWYALWWLICLHLENLWRVTVAYQRYFCPFFWNFWRYQKPYIQLLSKSKYKVHCTFQKKTPFNQCQTGRIATFEHSAIHILLSWLETLFNVQQSRLHHSNCKFEEEKTVQSMSDILWKIWSCFNEIWIVNCSVKGNCDVWTCCNKIPIEHFKDNIWSIRLRHCIILNLKWNILTPRIRDSSSYNCVTEKPG